MTKARDLANLISAGNPLADGALAASEVSGLHAVATSGAYANLTGTPTLATVATSGAYADVTGTPSLATVATSGAYSDLSGSPSGDSLLPSQSGNTGKFLTSNGSAASWADVGGGGKVLQVVTSSYTGHTNINSNSFTDIPLSVNITLTSSSNRVMVWAMGGTLEAGGASTGSMYARLIRKIGSGSDTTLSEGNAQQTANKSAISQGTVLALGGGDAPSTSSAVTYKVQAKSDNGNTIHINYYGAGDMTIIAMEIAV